ncbi:MAG: DUF4445 domain-containing protein [Actinobacteria bacterium]|nr:DUF4445 domain-containing protein [Actinomycetota bacterium]
MTKKKFTVDVEPIGKRIYLDKPTNALHAIIDAGIALKSVCGGKGTCGKCRIIILDNANTGTATKIATETGAITGSKTGIESAEKISAEIVPEANEQEKKVLSQSEISHGVRLACQQKFSKDVSVYIPASSLTEEQKLQISGEETEIAVDPIFKKYFICLSKPTLSDMESDFSRIKRTIKEQFGVSIENIDYRVLAGMPEILRTNNWQVTATVRGSEIILVEGGDQTKNAYGIAVDLGTTKIAVLLIDLLSGKTIDRKGVMNPQISFGEDVMSRINYAMQSRQNADKIQKVVIEQLNTTVDELAEENGITTAQIIEMTLVGNTAMHHLLLGFPVRQLGLSPFVSLTTSPLEIKAREIGISISTGAYIYLLPPIAGFVGSDHVSVVLAAKIDDTEGNCIGIDIGTNTEIVLKSKRGFESVSTASGPAFEGAHIKYGMRAAPGAIERVIIEPDTCTPKIQTINDKKPVGICGSGILDAVAEMLKSGIINSRGKFQSESKCLCSDERGSLQYILEPSEYRNLTGEEEANGPDLEKCPLGKVSINQADIVEIQLAKSAIRTGINVLLESAGLDFDQIDRVIIAGAFGSYIDPKNVVNIGMFPKVSLKKITQIGNAASVGAKMVLISGMQRKKAEEIAKKIKYLELTVFPTFSDHFAKSTLFPEPSEII